MAEKKATFKKIAGKATPKAPTKAVAQVAEKPKHLQPHELLTSHTIQNAVSIHSWGKFAGEAELGPLLTELRNQVKKVVHDGNMKPAEAMLYGQAMALQTIFTNLARRAAGNDDLKQFQVNMILALKAQAQCRATIEALALVKNPMPYIKQANISNGHQQVNNGVNPEKYAQAHASAGDFQSTPNKLLEDTHERLDIGAAQAASRVNQPVGTVG